MSVDMDGFGVRIEVARAGTRSRILLLAIKQSDETSETIHQLRQRFNGALGRQAEQMEEFNQYLEPLQRVQPQLAQAAIHLIKPLGKTLTNNERAKEPSPSRILSFVCKLAATTHAEQVFASSAEKTARMNVGSALFDVRERAARGSSASGLDLKLSRDAQGFSKLLVSEIELYNKSGVEEGRRNRDLYQRLKKGIDRSRETYEKRFANTMANRVDCFYEELVGRLAENDSALLGSDYPGPSV